MTEELLPPSSRSHSTAADSRTTSVYNDDDESYAPPTSTRRSGSTTGGKSRRLSSMAKIVYTGSTANIAAEAFEEGSESDLTQTQGQEQEEQEKLKTPPTPPLAPHDKDAPLDLTDDEDEDDAKEVKQQQQQQEGKSSNDSVSDSQPTENLGSVNGSQELNSSNNTHEEHQEREKAAIKVQALYRGFKARRESISLLNNMGRTLGSRHLASTIEIDEPEEITTSNTSMNSTSQEIRDTMPPFLHDSQFSKRSDSHLVEPHGPLKSALRSRANSQLTMETHHVSFINLNPAEVPATTASRNSKTTTTTPPLPTATSTTTTVAGTTARPKSAAARTSPSSKSSSSASASAVSNKTAKVPASPAKRRRATPRRVNPVKLTGFEFSRGPIVESMAEQLIQGRRAEVEQLNKLILLRLTNPWSSITNSDLLCSSIAWDKVQRELNSSTNTAENSARPPPPPPNAAKAQTGAAAVKPKKRATGSGQQQQQRTTPNQDQGNRFEAKTRMAEIYAKPVGPDVDRMKLISNARAAAKQQEAQAAAVKVKPLDPVVFDRLTTKPKNTTTGRAKSSK